MNASGEKRPWRSENHYRKAISEVKATHYEVRADRKEDAALERPDLFEKRSDGKHTYASFAVGDHVGSLTLLERLTDKPVRVGGHQWRTKCDCGRSERLVFSHHLAYAVRKGVDPACSLCREERTKLRFEGQREVTKEAWRKQFVDIRTLWSPSQTARLRGWIWQDLEDAFGQVDEEVPSLRTGSLEFEPAWDENGVVYGWRRTTADREAAAPSPLSSRQVPDAVVRTGDEKKWTKRDVPKLTPDGLTDRVLDRLHLFEVGKEVRQQGRPTCACPCGSLVSYWKCHGDRYREHLSRRIRQGILQMRKVEETLDKARESTRLREEEARIRNEEALERYKQSKKTTDNATETFAKNTCCLV